MVPRESLAKSLRSKPSSRRWINTAFYLNQYYRRTKGGTAEYFFLFTEKIRFCACEQYQNDFHFLNFMKLRAVRTRALSHSVSCERRLSA